MADPDDERLHAELDRQLAEVRAACDGLATRSGLLVAAISAAALILGPRVDPAHHENLLVVTAIALFVAAVCAVVTLVPGLKAGPDRGLLEKWMSGGASGKTSKKLYTSKVSILGGNLERLNTMRNYFAVQGIATVIGVGLALCYAALR